MKKIRLTAFSVLLIWGFGSGCYSNQSISNRTLKRDYCLVEPDKNLFCSKYEVTNQEYSAFLLDLKTKNYSEYEKCKVDTSGWDGVGALSKPFKENYNWHPAFDDFPVVNIPLYGAEKYCEWLTENRNDSEISFRLPTEIEFTKLLETTNVNLKSDSEADYSSPNFNLVFQNDRGLATTKAKHFVKQNKNHFIQHENGATHIIGNVSEYLEDGRSAGGSWNSYPSEVTIINDAVGANAKTGFRVWMLRKN